MRQANEMHIVKGLMFCGMESFKLDVPGLVMANIYQKKKKKDIPYKIRVLKIVLREGGKKKNRTENTGQSVWGKGKKIK